MSYIKVNGHDFNDSGVCMNCGKDFMDVEGEDCHESEAEG